MMGALSIAIAYGIDVNLKNDPNIHYAEEAVKGLAGAANFGAFLVNSVPTLRYVPSWFPGAAWKRQAHVWNDWTSKMREIPFQQSLKQLVSSSHISRSPAAYIRVHFIDCNSDRCITQAEGTVTPSLVTNSIHGIEETQDREHQMTVIKDTAGNFFVGTKRKIPRIFDIYLILFLGGADTTVSAIGTFFLMMICYPEIQEKAQAELDRVVGKGHLPDYGDEVELPYISALVKETIRYDSDI